ncbi:MAG: anaerobic ribonucleoside-triphosphate reductase activating protein [Coriobacteriales bacterium]|nr:anaerobic ribonucleoside-triphosphate reductase activating protein [Coriobacteriales bacterium]
MARGAQTLELPTGATTARIAGYIGGSVDAWPGRRASTVLIAGCTMRCPYCSNPELISTSHRSEASLADILAHCARKPDGVDGVVLSGGEPTEDTALLELLEALRAEGIPVKLDTNGVNPEVLHDVVDRRLVDFVALDVKATPARYDAVTGLPGSWPRILESIAILIQSGVEHEFRTTCYPLAVSISDLSTIARQLAGGRRYVLQQFSAQRTLDPAARTLSPIPVTELLRAVDRCNPYLPTVVRGG